MTVALLIGERIEGRIPHAGIRAAIAVEWPQSCFSITFGITSPKRTSSHGSKIDEASSVPANAIQRRFLS